MAEEQSTALKAFVKEMERQAAENGDVIYLLNDEWVIDGRRFDLERALDCAFKHR